MADSDVYQDYSVRVDREVSFTLTDGPIVKRDDGRYFRIDFVKVRLPQDREPQIHSSGHRVAKDGHLPATWGNTISSAPLPDPDVWVERARNAG